jgi:hypothetical protein
MVSSIKNMSHKVGTLAGLSSLLDISGLTGTALRSEYKDHTDPAYIGPGHWNIIHRKAFGARTVEKQQEFVSFMKEVCSGFPCTVCRGHCADYITNHPMEEYVGSKVEVKGEVLPIGLFVWTVVFHNAVNARLGKPIMAWTTAYEMYSDTNSTVCSAACHDATPVPSTQVQHTLAPYTPVPSEKYTPMNEGRFRYVIPLRK